MESSVSREYQMEFKYRFPVWVWVVLAVVLAGAAWSSWWDLVFSWTLGPSVIKDLFARGRGAVDDGSELNLFSSGLFFLCFLLAIASMLACQRIKERNATVSRWLRFAVILFCILYGVLFFADEYLPALGYSSPLDRFEQSRSYFVFLVSQFGALVLAAFSLLWGWVFMGAVIYWLWSTVLKARRWRTVLDSAGMTVTDWRGNERTTEWTAVQQVRSSGTGTFSTTLVITDERAIAIPQWFIRNRQTLIDEIISRAGLKQTSEDNSPAVFSRP